MAQKKEKPEMQQHRIAPVFDTRSEILILGSFPSVKSRETGFFYGHPKNRFWPLLAALFREEVPQTIPQKKELLLRRHIALWDVVASCTITGSSDSSIRDVVPTELERILRQAPIRQIFCNGGTAERFFRKYQQDRIGRTAIRLPSTSPANAAWSLEKLQRVWGEAFRPDVTGSEDRSEESS